MKTRPEDLAAEGFTLLDEFEHAELIPFVQACLKRRTASVILYVAANVVAAALIAAAFFARRAAGDLDVGRAVRHLWWGCALAFLFVPLHEYLHILAYRRLGADRTSFQANLRKFFFLAVADRFVASRREFRIVALAPFTVISSLLLASLPLAGPYGDFTILGALMLHTGMTSGDFGLLSYFDTHRGREVVTFDDAANGVTYFYARPPGAR